MHSKKMMSRSCDVRFGVVQGRLLPPVGDQIQAFPDRWREELIIAPRVGCRHIEWIVTESCVEQYDASSFARLTRQDVEYIRGSGVDIESVCFDGLMAHDMLLESALLDVYVSKLACHCVELGMKRIVMPFLGQASIQLPTARQHAVRLLNTVIDRVKRATGVDIVFSLETDLDPVQLREFMLFLRFGNVKVTFDTGNLLRLGHDLDTHVTMCGEFIDNVHVKDMTGLLGTTAPLNSGLLLTCGSVLGRLHELGIQTFTLQTARDTDCSELQTFKRNVEIVSTLIDDYYESMRMSIMTPFEHRSSLR